MTKSDLVVKIYERHPELGRHLAEDAVSLFFSEITAALQKGQRVELRGFGVFFLRKRDQRTGRNPKTGETVKVSQKLAPFFRAGKELKDILNKPQTASMVRSRNEKNPSAFHSHQQSVR